MKLKELKISSLFKYKYSKLIILTITVTLAYLIFREPGIYKYINSLNSLSYAGVFIAGMLFVFMFSAPFGIGYFVALNPANLWLAAIIGGVGAATADVLIFKFFKASFKDEIEDVEDNPIFKKFSKRLKTKLKAKVRLYLMYLLAGFIIATPLPDEVGVLMLAGLKKVDPVKLAIIAFFMHTIMIGLLLGIRI